MKTINRCALVCNIAPSAMRLKRTMSLFSNRLNRVLFFLLCIIFLNKIEVSAQGIAINTDGSTADNSAILDIKSTTQGTLIPRMTKAERDNLVGSDGIAGHAPATACLIYQTDNTPGYYYYNGTAWTPLFSGTNGWTLAGNTLSGTEFLGSVNAQPLIFKTNNTEWIRVLSTGTVGIGTTNPGAKFGVSGSDQYVAYFQGTQTATDGVTQYSVVSGSTFSPSSSTTNVSPYLAYANFQPGSGVTITNAAGMFIVQGTQGGAGSVTNGYGLYVDNPNFGTNKYAAYFGGKVGIGIAIPTFKLHVYNSDPALGINSYSQFSPVLTANQAANLHSQWNEINTFSAYDYNCSLYAAVNRVNITDAQTGTINMVDGSANDIYNSGTGLISFANGSYNEVRNILTGSITNAYGSSNLVQNMSTGTITNAHGVISAIGNSGGGTITNGYGLYVGVIEATNKWSIYTYDATAPSYFAGNVGVGTTSPNARLDVKGSGNTSASFGFGVRNSSDAYTLVVRDDGAVGIGTTIPSYRLTVAGNIYATGDIYLGACALWLSPSVCSDVRYKKDIVPIKNALTDVVKLQGVKYNWRQDEFPDMHFNDRRQIGLIAQDVEKIFPEIVNTNNEGYKNIDYAKLTPILVEAIKEQQQGIKNCEFRISNLETTIGSLQLENKNIQELTLMQQKEIEKIKQQLGLEVKK
ncbi:MAG TPA: hypothetical protein DEH02_07410 [Bacteroidales bacterium]|nr:hypothetical protein [Bacteroidales bacterium]